MISVSVLKYMGKKHPVCWNTGVPLQPEMEHKLPLILEGCKCGTLTFNWLEEQGIKAFHEIYYPLNLAQIDESNTFVCIMGLKQFMQKETSDGIMSIEHD